MDERGLKTVALTDVNGQILEVADESVAHGEEWEFFCECGRPDCHEHVTLGVAAFSALRDGAGAVLAPGHRLSRAEQARRRARRLREDSQALRGQAQHQVRRARRQNDPPSYAVLWRQGDGPALAGRLELSENTLWLRGGGNRWNEQWLAVPYSEIAGLERGPEMRIGRCHAITIFRHNASDVLLASIGGVGALGEIFGFLQQALIK